MAQKECTDVLMIVMVGTMGALTAAGAKATVQGTFEYNIAWKGSFECTRGVWSKG